MNYRERPPASRELRKLAVAAGCLLLATIPCCKLADLPASQALVSGALPDGTAIPRHWASDRAAKQVSNDWLKSFNDPRLNSLVAEALKNNLNLRQAAAQVEAARERVVVVNSQLLPQVGIGASGDSIKDEDHPNWGHGKKAVADISWEPDVWGRLRAQRDAAGLDYQAAALDYAYARQSLAATVAKSWYLAVETRQLVTISEEAVGIYSRLLDLVKIQRTAGSATDLGIAEASANLNAAQAELRRVRGLSSEARRNLEQLLGRYPAAEIEVARSFAPVPPPVRSGMPSSLLARRPDLVASECLVLSSLRAGEAARLAFLPAFTLDLKGGILSNGILSLLRVNPWLFRTALGMDVPVYQGGRLIAEVRITDAQQTQALAAYGSAVLTAFREVENALTNEQLIDERIRFQEAELRNRIEAVRIANVQYKSGSLDLLSVLQLQESQIACQADLVKLRNARLANRINLHLALGGNFAS